MNVHVRWMIRRDMPSALAIENQFEFPWTEEDFIRALRSRNIIGMVAEHDETVVGFMLYELFKDRLHVLNFAVRQDCQMQGIGRQMVDKLIGKLSRQRRRWIDVIVRERNLDAQLFFRACGFRAISVLRNHYDEHSEEDGYLLQYRVKQEAWANQ